MVETKTSGSEQTPGIPMKSPAVGPRSGFLTETSWRLESLWVVLLAFLLHSCGLLASNPKRKPFEQRPTEPVVHRNTAPGVGYVGSGICAGCHKKLYDEFRRTSMGRSMSLPSHSSQLENVFSPITIFNKRLNRYFQVFRQDSDLYQSEYELDPEGREVFKHTQKIEYVMGSGENGFSYVVRRGDFLFQAPLSFYSKPQTWGLSPGYEFRDYGFNRPILPACIVCHSGRPQVVPKRNGLYRNPPFQELAIGCENCHGPGQLHVEERVEGRPLAGDADNAIVNPAKLPTWLADNICMNCHEAGDARILQPGKNFMDFRPGNPLNNTLAIFKVPLKRESLSPLLGHHFSVMLSKCFQESGGNLSCLTCHNPHKEPSPQEVPAYYRNKCLSCHTEKSCALPLEIRLRKSAPDDCAGCHMPKQNLKTIAHSALTNHRIIAHEGEPYPEVALHMTTPELPDLIQVNAFPDKRKKSLPPLTLLKAYGEIMASHPEYKERFVRLLDQLAQNDPDNVFVLSLEAWKASKEGTPDGLRRSIQYLSRAIELGSTFTKDYQLLAELLARSGRKSEAIKVLKRGIALDPYNSELYKALALSYISDKKYAKALETMNEELRLFPEDSFMRMLLKKAETAPPEP